MCEWSAQPWKRPVCWCCAKWNKSNLWRSLLTGHRTISSGHNEGERDKATGPTPRPLPIEDVRGNDRGEKASLRREAPGANEEHPEKERGMKRCSLTPVPRLLKGSGRCGDWKHSTVGGTLGMTFLYRVVNARQPHPLVFKRERMSCKCVFSRVSRKFWSQVDVRNGLTGGNEESVLVENFRSEWGKKETMNWVSC